MNNIIKIWENYLDNNTLQETNSMISITDGCSTHKVTLDRTDKIYVVINHEGNFFAPYTVVSLSGELGDLKGQVVLSGSKGAIIVCPSLDNTKIIPFKETNDG